MPRWTAPWRRPPGPWSCGVEQWRLVGPRQLPADRAAGELTGVEVGVETARVVPEALQDRAVDCGDHATDTREGTRQSTEDLGHDGAVRAGGSLVHPGYMDSVVVYGFVAAVLGGLDSPAGAVLGGLLLGLSLSFVSGYVGSELVALASLVILMLVLLIKPGGLFSHAAERRV